MGRAASKPRKPAAAKVKRFRVVPHRIVGELRGAVLNEHGDIVGEEQLGAVDLFAANFGKLPQIVKARMAEAEKERDDAESDRQKGAS